jgi:DNA-binding transcriptional regulator YhcF (GntR family)
MPSKKPEEKETKANPDYVKFIEEYRTKGYSDEQIIEAMIEAGLTQEEIEAAIKEASKQ